jgi:hypothetical protein
MIRGIKEREEVRRARVRQLFLARAAEDRSEIGTLLFYKWIEEHYPDLVRRSAHGNPYDILKGDLEGLLR